MKRKQAFLTATAMNGLNQLMPLFQEMAYFDKTYVTRGGIVDQNLLNHFAANILLE